MQIFEAFLLMAYRKTESSQRNLNPVHTTPKAACRLQSASWLSAKLMHEPKRLTSAVWVKCMHCVVYYSSAVPVPWSSVGYRLCCYCGSMRYTRSCITPGTWYIGYRYQCCDSNSNLPAKVKLMMQEEVNGPPRHIKSFLIPDSAYLVRQNVPGTTAAAAAAVA